MYKRQSTKIPDKSATITNTSMATRFVVLRIWSYDMRVEQVVGVEFTVKGAFFSHCLHCFSGMRFMLIFQVPLSLNTNSPHSIMGPLNFMSDGKISSITGFVKYELEILENWCVLLGRLTFTKVLAACDGTASLLIVSPRLRDVLVER